MMSYKSLEYDLFNSASKAARRRNPMFSSNTIYSRYNNLDL